VLLSLFQPLADTSACAQERASQLVVTVDGSKEPEKVPEWILWREMFMVAGMLSEKSPTRGQEVWVGRVGLSAVQMDGVISRAQLFRASETALDQQVKELRADAALSAETLKARLAEKTIEKQVNVLGHRDGLQAAIGAEAIGKMLAFARQHIAPTVKVGGASGPAPTAGGARVR
jgi:hypothetical protein